ncbi:Sel1 repeat-containing protein 1 -like protein, partial [Trichinella nativa]
LQLDVMPDIDFSNNEEVEKYLKNLYIEYTYSCNVEKRPSGCHLLGDYVEAYCRDFKKAFEIYKENCERTNYARSCFKYGKYLINGKFVPRDDDKAFQVLESACEDNLAIACPPYAFLNMHGTPKHPPCLEKTFEAMDKACNLEMAEACYWLSSKYATGFKTILQDGARAVEYATKACNLGLGVACDRLSNYYRKGLGTERSEKKAAEFAELAQQLRDDGKHFVHYDITG